MVKIIAFLLSAATAFGATFHVSQAGSGTLSGTTEENAWPITAFNTSTNWSTAGTAGKISPGDTVMLYGALSGGWTNWGSGRSDAKVRVEFAPGSTFSGSYRFYGRDHIDLVNMRLPDDMEVGGFIIYFGRNSGDMTTNCTVSGLYSLRKTGGAIVSMQYSVGATLTNCSILDFEGEAITGDAATYSPTVINCDLITTTNGVTTTTDLIKLGWATSALIQGNRLILQTDKAGGDPHNDCLQAWHNYSDMSQTPESWTVRNNWFEIRDCSGGAFYNWGMIQWATGNWLIEGNVFYTHDTSSGAGNGFNISRYATNDLAVTFRNNTFFSSGSLNNMITSSGDVSQTGVTNAAGKSIELYNNIFVNASSTSGQPILEAMSQNGGTLTMSNNLFYGWAAAIGYLPFDSSSVYASLPFNESLGLGGRRLTELEISGLMVDITNADFSLKENSVAIGNAFQIATPSVIHSPLMRDSFPNPQTGLPATLDIGAFDYQSMTTSAPAITTHPQSASRTVGESVSFSATAAGNPTPTYQWRKDGSNISGATGATYTISSVQLTDAGSYDCVASNSEGSATSAAATLAVVTAQGGGSKIKIKGTVKGRFK